MKITVVGAGAVGASCAEYIAIKNFASEVVLLDIKEGYAEGKAMDLMQTASLNGFDTKISGTTGDYSKTADSHIAVITSGIPRKPGMTREELIGINAGIVRTVATSLIEHSPNVILIVVSNPMDTMTYLVHKITDLPKHKIIGIRPGEKLHEQMISIEDSYSTYEYANYYKILPQINEWQKDNLRIKAGKKVSEGFVYSSDNNKEWMTKNDLQKWISSNKNFIGKL